MKTKIIKTQKEFDEIKDTFEGLIEIVGNLERVNRSFNNANIVVMDNATIEYVYNNATIESVYGNATIKSVYGNATIKYVYNNATIKYVYDNATIESVYNNATIESVYGNATIKSVSGNATIKYVYDNATIEYVYGNATIKSVYGNATIKSVSGNATIKYVSDNATIKSVYGNATIIATGYASILMVYGNASITTHGRNIVRHKKSEKSIKLKLSNNTTHIILPDFKPTFTEYKNLYPVKTTKTKAILYKAVHKKDGRYIADYDNTTEYKIGETLSLTCSKDKEESCGEGIHLSHLDWAYRFGRDWDDLAILECETNIKDIVVAKDCDGKVRTSKVKVLREVPKE